MVSPLSAVFFPVSIVRTWINEGDDALEAVQIAMSSHAFTILRFVWWNS